jgi:hypothetical protein
VLATVASAQTLVRYGDSARRGEITRVNETHRFLLLGAKGDILRITFSSQYAGSGYYVHQLAVSEGAVPVGSPILGLGPLTVMLPSTAYYTIEVRARNFQSNGWYAFQVDRLNDPAGADRIAFNWNMKGSITYAAGFAVYTLRAEAGSSGDLQFTSQYAGSGYYIHYAEVLDPTGKRLAAVDGTGQAAVKFGTTGIYTVLVAARNYQSTGWYGVSVRCHWSMTAPCDCAGHSSNFGKGCSGTNDVPTLTASMPPKLGAMAGIDIGNSSNKSTLAILLIGIDTDNQAAFGCTLLVAAPIDLQLPLPPAGATVSLAIPNDPLWCGLGVAVQSVQFDEGAGPAKLAFSRGLLLLLGR